MMPNTEEQLPVNKNKLLELIEASCNELRRGRHASGAKKLLELIPPLIEHLMQAPETDRTVVQQSLAQALEAQERGDWITLADELQYVLARQLA